MSTILSQVLAASAMPSLQRFSVELIIRNFQVTATNRLLASSYAAEDAREFLPNWNYTVGRVCPAPAAELTPAIVTATKTTSASLPIAIVVQKDPVPDGGRDRLYTCEATYTVVVDAADRYSAGEVALRLVTEACRIQAQLAAYREQAFWDKLLPIARAPFSQMAEVLRQRGFDATVRASGDGDVERFQAIDVSRDGEQLGTVSLVRHLTGAAASPALHFAGVNDVQARSIPDQYLDVWLNDAQVRASDVACLDLDAFDTFFDLVLDQCEEARTSEAPAYA